MVTTVQAASLAAPAVSHAASALTQAASSAAGGASDGWLGIPWILWSGLLSASVASLVSYLTTNASAKNSLALLKQQQMHDDMKSASQREHDAKMKRDDRKGTIRREVYLDAVEKAHALLAAIGALPQRGTDTSEDGEAFQEFLKANAKVWLVAESDAAHLSRDLAAQFASLFLLAVRASLPARQALEPARATTKLIEHEEEEALRLQRQANDARILEGSEERQQRLGELLEEANAWIDHLKALRSQQQAEAAPVMFKAFADTFGEMRAVQRTLWTLVSMLRDELHLPPDLEQFMEQLRLTEQQAWAAVNEACGIKPPAAMPELIDPVPKVA